MRCWQPRTDASGATRDVPDIARAAFGNVRSGAVAQGASTLTQQYVDLTTPGEQRTYRQKFREIVAAWKYERHLGKDEILDRYLNVVPFGRDTTGIDAAAQVYFGVSAADLDVNQAATLAGMIAAPSSFDPADNPDGAERRRDVVLRGMRDQGWLPASEVRTLMEEPMPEVRPGPLVKPGEDAYFVDAVRRRLQEILPDTDLSRGLRVFTTMNPRIQEAAQRAVTHHVGTAAYTGAAVTIDPGSGAVRALVGGSGFAEESYNAAIQARRQPGSAFKPFTLAAFVDEGWSPDESEFPAPRTIEVDTPDGPHEVENFGGASYDELTVREATERSVNTVYMQMIEELGPGRVADMARTLGLEGEIPEVPSLTLGTASVSPLSMASAYATLAAEGVHHEPHLVARVVDEAGEVLYEHSPEGERVTTGRRRGGRRARRRRRARDGSGSRHRSRRRRQDRDDQRLAGRLVRRVHAAAGHVSMDRHGRQHAHRRGCHWRQPRGSGLGRPDARSDGTDGGGAATDRGPERPGGAGPHGRRDADLVAGASAGAAAVPDHELADAHADPDTNPDDHLQSHAHGERYELADADGDPDQRDGGVHGDRDRHRERDHHERVGLHPGFVDGGDVRRVWVTREATAPRGGQSRSDSP